MKLLAIILSVFIVLGLNAQVYEYPFQNPKLSTSERVNDLIGRLTLDEKVGQLMFKAPAIEKLGIEKYNWWNECLHGVARSGRATVFPQAIGMAATFDTDLMNRIGVAISDEARAKFNQVRARGKGIARYAGLTFWSPNVNLFRDPRWGRGQETYGEDPYLISQLGVSFVNGLQGDGKILKTAAMAKHYAVHSGPEKLRHEFDAVVSRHDLWNTYLPAFEALVVDAKVEGVMGAYNRTNGDACCAHPYLMGDVLYGKWQFDGYFVSDCWAIVDFYNGHKIVKDDAAAAALALKEGCTLNCGATFPALTKSVAQGLIDEKTIDKGLRQLLPTRFELGLFDPVGSVVFDNIDPSVVRSKKHIDLTYEAARKSIVLLKNKDNLLPLSKDLDGIYVTGPVAADAQALLANYYGVSDNLRTILEGIASNTADHTALRYVQGGLLDRPNDNPMDWFSEEAEVTDVTIACMGITQLLEGEEGEAIASKTFGDRVELGLPQHQIDYLKLLRSKAKNLVVVITGGSAISIPEIHELADAVLYAWYPGEQGGQAIGDIIFGKHSPSGKLPVTFVNTIDDLPPFEDYDMQGRTYRYMDVEPLYPFGFGLSYGDIQYSNVEVDKTKFRKKDKLNVMATVSNKSDIDVEEVVQVFVSKKNKSQRDEHMALKAFKRIKLKAGESQKVSFQLDAKAFSMYDDNGNLQLNKGKYDVIVSSSAPMQRSLDLGAPKWGSAVVTVR